MKKVAVCGYFGGKNKLGGGQGAKTRNLFDAFVPIAKCRKIDTHKGNFGNFALLLKIINAFFWCDYFCVCTSRGGVKRILPILHKLKKFKKVKIYYFSVGICPFPVDYRLGDPITTSTIKLGNLLKKCDFVFVETKVFAAELKNRLNLENVKVFKNYISNYPPISPSKEIRDKESLKLVYFSRIIHEKNPLILVDAVERLNKQGFNVVVDFFGFIEDNIKKEFMSHVNDKNIFYKGIFFGNPTEMLSQYDCLVFTTTYLEGTPGTIINAFFASIPVVSQPFWASSELISIPKTGIVNKDIYDVLLNVCKRNIDLGEYAINASKYAKKYYSKYCEEEIESIFQDGFK